MRAEARRAVGAELDLVLNRRESEDAARAVMALALPAFFEAKAGPFAAATRKGLATRLAPHQRRANELIGLVRRAAAELMVIPYEAPDSAEAFEIHWEPYWVASGRTETLNPLRAGSLDGLLPETLRKTRSRKRLLAELDAAVGRNVENLRWATRQNVETAFRRFGTALDEQLEATLAATQGAMAVVLERRKREGERVDSELEPRRQAAARFDAITESLQDFACLVHSDRS